MDQINCRAFFDKVMETPHLQNEFITTYLANGQPVFDTARLQIWLQHYSKALLVLMAAVNALAGSPSQGTELTFLQLQNTPYQSRGIYAIGHRMAITVQYSKKSATTGCNSLIPHALDAFCQEIIKVVVFRTHPFAQQIVKILYPGRDDILNLWNNYLFVNKDCLFTTEDLSGILETVSLKKMGIPVGVREYRHIQVFIRWTHCSTMWSSLGLRDEDSTAALQAGHQLETEEQLYGMSGSYLGQIPEYLVEPLL